MRHSSLAVSSCPCDAHPARLSLPLGAPLPNPPLLAAPSVPPRSASTQSTPSQILLGPSRILLGAPLPNPLRHSFYPARISLPPAASYAILFFSRAWGSILGHIGRTGRAGTRRPESVRARPATRSAAGSRAWPPASCSVRAAGAGARRGRGARPPTQSLGHRGDRAALAASSSPRPRRSPHIST